jgi:HPt (histidine-containing phosphotransfer) domain-containing protein
MTGAAGSGTVDTIDPEALSRLARLGGEKLVRQMIDLFFEHATQHMAVVHQSDDKTDSRALEHAAHALKSSAGNLGATRLWEAAAEVEAAVATGNRNQLDRLIADCGTEFSKVSAELAEIRASL